MTTMMTFIRHSVSIALTIISFLLVTGLPSAQSEREKAAKSVVESFCKDEFEADLSTQRKDLVKFTPAREKIEKKRTEPALPWVIFWDWDSFIIVSSYKVVQVSVTSDSATAIVEYRVVGKSKGKGEIVPLKLSSDTIKLNLIYDGKQWWIIDPSLPKISRDKLIYLYEYEFQHNYNEEWLRTASKQQLKYYTRRKESLKELKNLPK